MRARGDDVPALLDHAAASRAQGFRALRLQCGIPGSAEPQLAPRGPAMAAAGPLEQFWDSGAYLRFAPRMLEAARGALGDQAVLLHDIHHRLTPIEAARLARAVEPLNLFWLEDLAALWQIRTAFHGAADMSPVTFGAALHLGRAISNFGIQEYAGHPPEAEHVFRHAWRYSDGCLTSGEVPGHGVTIDEAEAARFPYERAYLPVCRLADGTLWNY